jgi:hypothetical protein
MIPDQTFSFADWEDCLLPDLPRPIDTYRPSWRIKWGSNPNRGLGIQRARAQKAHAANVAFFRAHVLPIIADKINAADWFALGDALGDDTLKRRGGWVRYTAPGRASWVHPDLQPDRVTQALAMGGQPENL